jgi:hypothetical protein
VGNEHGGGGIPFPDPPSDAPADYPWFASLWSSITERLENVKNSIIGGLVEPFTAIGDGFASIGNAIGNLFRYFNPYDEHFFLKVALIPREGYFEEKVTDIKDTFLEKFLPIVTVFDAFKSIKNYENSTVPPSFTVTMPKKYGSGTFEIIDFDMFHQYRTLVLNFIRFIALFFFVKWIIRKGPELVK